MLKIIPHVDGTPRICELVRYQLEDIELKESWSAPAELQKQPSLEFASPEQIGATAVFLCSGAADQIRGTCISVDGGWTAQ